MSEGSANGSRQFALHHSFAEASMRVSMYRSAKKAGRAVPDEKYKKEVHMDEHILEPEDLAERLKTDLTQGLTSQEAASRLARDGPNRLTPPKGVPWWKQLLKHFFGGFALLLWVAAALAFVTFGIAPEEAWDNLYIGIVLVVVVVGTGIFSFYQDSKALAVMKGFHKLVPTRATVIRGGAHAVINAEELVIGDIVDISGGAKVPADLRIIQASGLKVDNSSLTGESEPQSRRPQMTDENPLETKNIAFFTTPVVEGTGRGIVIGCGDNTIIGRIAGLAQKVKLKKTPIAREIEHLVKIIAAIALVTGVIMLIFALIKYGVSNLSSVTKSILFAIGIIVAAVPEGLLATVTVALTLTAKRMAAHNLECVEALGSTTTICSDKTGTLTQNRMSAAHLWYDGHTFSTSTSVTKGSFDSKAPTFEHLHNIMALCNTAQFDAEDMDTPVIQRRCISGNATEIALLKFCHEIRDIYEHRSTNLEVIGIPFNSNTKWQISINIIDQPNAYYGLFLKGAPERVIDICDKISIKGKAVKLNKKHKKSYQSAYEKLGGSGERAIGCAYLELPIKKFPKGFTFDTDNINFPLKHLTFAGMISLIDPPREAVPGAVAICKSASVKVIMVTGDHPLTALSIAKQVGIIENETAQEIAKREGIDVSSVTPDRCKAIVVTGSELSTMSQQDLDQILLFEEIVFARTSPEQKLLIVEGCQRAGQIVAVTGDGVNDSPALRKADIGIAMGISGSDVSKEAADLVLLDDNFASIIKGIEQGRTIFDNLKKSVAYKLTANIPELIPFLLYAHKAMYMLTSSFVIAGLPLMLTTILILWIDVGTDMWPAISLAYERPESDLMSRPPRNAKKDKLVSSSLVSFAYLQIGLIQGLSCLFAFMVVMGLGNRQDNGFPPVSLWNLGDEFLVQESRNYTYNICRISRSPPRRLIGCAPTVEELDNLTLAINPNWLPNGSWSNGITEKHISDWCFDEKHTKAQASCRESGTFSGGRMELLRAAQTTYFIGVILCQWICLLICKTRISSVFQHVRSYHTSKGWLFENLIGLLLVYVPPFNIAFGTEPMQWHWYLSPLPYMFLIFAYDEIRKLIIRKYPDGWVSRHTKY